jgi:hypothetical protein
MTWTSFIYVLFAVSVVFLIITTLGKNLRKYKAVKCGHTTRLKGKLKAFGEKCTLKMPKNKDGTVDYCLDCLAEMTTKCAWCGKAIFIGDPVTLYTPKDPNYQPPEKEYSIYSRDPLRLVGCLRMSCGDSGMDRAGFWYPPGEVLRVLSPTEECIQKNGTVLVNDARNPSEAISMKG